MSKPVYELPDDGENYPPATSRRAARAAERPADSPDFAQAPPAAAPAGGFDSYLNAPPPTSQPFPAPSPQAEANYANSSYPEIKFDPNAYDAPAPSATFDLGSPSFDAPAAASFAAPAFDPAAFAPPSAFDPAAFAPPSAFDPAAFAPPSAFDPAAFAPPSAFDPAAFPPPAAFDAPAFDPAAFPPPAAFDPPAFDPAAFPPPPAAFEPSAFDAPTVPPAFAPASFPPPFAESAVPSAPEPWESTPVATPRSAVVPPAASDPATTDFATLADQLPPIFEPPAMYVKSPSETPVFEVPPVDIPFDLTIPHVEEFAPSEPEPEPKPFVIATDFGERTGAHARVEPKPQPAADAPVPVPEIGLGQEGSDPDLVSALNAVVALGASDLHVTVKATPMVRVDGGLRAVPDTIVWDEEKVAFALRSVMSEEQIETFERELELDFAYRLSENSRFRVNIYQQRNSMGAAFRLIPTKIKQLEDLGIPEKVGKFSQLPRGLVLVTGPTGSGKSTTLAALIDLVNQTRADHIVTVEDPIEFMHTNKKSVVNQREVGADTHSFNNALKHVLRQDPDVILIGELRDLETISVALTAAETGHLVFATLHTQDAPQTIDRVIDVFPPHQQGQVRTQLAATLQGVVCQTLVKKASGSGRVVATEVLVTTSGVANLIREGKTYQIHSAMQAGRDQGMHTMDQSLADLVNAGEISHEAAMEKANDVEVIKRLITRSEAKAHDGINFGDEFSGGQR